MVGEVAFGGVGSGLYGMLLFVLLAVFIAGLMVGRTPEYLGKKIEAREVKLVMIGTLAMPLLVLFTVALATATKYGAPSLFNSGPAGLLRAPLRLHVAGEQQRLRVRRLYRLRAARLARQRRRVRDHVRRHPGWPGDVRRALPPHAGRAGGRRDTRRESASRPLGPGTMRTDTPIFVVLLIGVDPPRRSPHVRPRPSPRPGRPGPDTPTLLRPMRKDIASSLVAVVALTVMLRPRLSARHHRHQPGRLPRPRRRQPDQEGRQGDRLAADRPGLQRPTTRCSSPARRRPATTRPAPRSRTSGRTARTSATTSPSTAGRTCASTRRTTRASRGQRSRPTQSRPRPLASTRRSRSPTPASRPAASRPGRGIPKARVLALVKDNTDDRALGLFGEPGVNVLDLNLAIQEARR